MPTNDEYKGPYLIISEQSFGRLTEVRHPMFFYPLEDYIKSDIYKVMDINGNEIIIIPNDK